MTRLPGLLAVLFTLAGIAPSSGKSLRVRTLALRAGDMPAVFLKGSKGFLPLRFSATQPAAPVSTLQANPLPLYKSEMDAEGKQVFTIAQRVKIPSGAKGILLLGWATGDKMEYVAIKDDFGSARFDDWLLINTTKKPIAFRVGQKSNPVQLAPGASRSYKITADKGKGAAILAQAPVDGKVKTFYSTYWPVHSDKRALVLFIDDGTKIRVKRISDALARGTPPTS